MRESRDSYEEFTKSLRNYS